MSGSQAQSFVQFYDPNFYELQIGPGRRVAELYSKYAKERGGPVLELGSGTGQVVLAIAQNGISAVGLEGAPAMLERALENQRNSPAPTAANARFIAGLIEDYEPDQEFKQIFFSNDVIGHIQDNEVLRQVFQRYRKRLSHRGRLIVDVSVFDHAYMGYFAQPSHQVPRWRGEAKLQDGRQISIWETTIVDLESGALTARFRYEVIDAQGIVTRVTERKLELYPRRAKEIATILGASGFDVVSETRHTDAGIGFVVFEAAEEG